MLVVMTPDTTHPPTSTSIGNSISFRETRIDSNTVMVGGMMRAEFQGSGFETGWVEQ